MSFKHSSRKVRIKKHAASKFTFLTHTFDLATYANPEAVRALLQKDASLGGGVGRDLTGDKATYHREWFGMSGPAEPAQQIADIVAHGDPASTERVTRALREAEGFSVPGSLAIKPVWQGRRATGQRFDLEAVLSGDPLPWGRFEPRRIGQGSKIVSLYAALGANADKSAEQLGWAPVAGLVVADLLEQAGYRVEIWGADRANQNHFKYSQIRVLLKGADVPLDLNAVTRATHPAIARALMMPLSLSVWGPSIVDPLDYGHTDRIKPSEFGDNDAVVVQHTYSLQEAKAEVARIVALFA